MRRLSATVLVLVLGGAAGRLLAGPQAPVASQTSDEEFLKGSYAADTPGLITPVVKYSPKPRYVPDAMRAKIQGTVELQVIVDQTGHVARARVTKSLDQVYGLDDPALNVAKQWTFEPGRLNGEAVPVAVALSLSFRLH
jgi:TonB family protein